MEENTLNKNLWQASGTAGLVLGSVSAVYLFLGNLLAGTAEQATLLQSVLTMGLWSTKFIACIWLMKFFMMKFAFENPEADKKKIFKMGMLTALHSSILFSGVYLADILYISPDLYENAFQQTIVLIKEALQLDANTLAALEETHISPSMLFLNNMTYCFLYGTIVAALVSFSGKLNNTFTEHKQDEQ